MAIETTPTLGTSVGSLVATTLANYRKEMADNIFTAIPVLAYMLSKGRMTEDGGATIVVPVMYAKSSTAKAYQGEDILDTTIQDPFLPAQYQWRFYASPISVMGTVAEVKNQGQSAVINYVKALIQHGEFSIKDRINQDLYATGVTGSINSLVALIDNTSTIGEINSTTQSWWQSVVTSSGSFAARGLSDLRSTYVSISQRNPQGVPDLIASDGTAYQAYEGTLVPQVRFSDAKMGDLGFENLKYHSAVWVNDANATSGVIYVIHSPSVQLVTHSARNFKIGEFIESIQQDVKVAKLLWAGELVTNNRRKLGKLTSVTA
jgi:hypothetical protein